MKESTAMRKVSGSNPGQVHSFMKFILLKCSSQPKYSITIITVFLSLLICYGGKPVTFQLVWTTHSLVIVLELLALNGKHMDNVTILVEF